MTLRGSFTGTNRLVAGLGGGLLGTFTITKASRGRPAFGYSQNRLGSLLPEHGRGQGRLVKARPFPPSRERTQVSPDALPLGQRSSQPLVGNGCLVGFGCYDLVTHR